MKFSSKKTPPSPAKKVPVLFDSGMVDFNLDTENPNNIVPKTVKISTGHLPRLGCFDLSKKDQG